MFWLNSYYIVSLPGSTLQCGMKKSWTMLEATPDQDFLLTIENKNTGGYTIVKRD